MVSELAFNECRVRDTDQRAAAPDVLSQQEVIEEILLNAVNLDQPTTAPGSSSVLFQQ